MSNSSTPVFQAQSTAHLHFSPSELPDTAAFHIAYESAYTSSQVDEVLESELVRFISPVLLEMGWKRKRRWSKTNQYFRYWVPPTPAS